MNKTDLEIAQACTMKPICDIAYKYGINPQHLQSYGNYKAKVDTKIFSELENKPNGKVILVSAITPTKAGEGKSTTTVGLVEGLNKIEKKAVAALREPSLGPVFGMKGGAAGGGYAQVVPMEDINLHFTGDMHAITCANNLVCAILDNHIYQGNELNIDPNKVSFKRCIDMNDRNLRKIEIGLGAKTNGVERLDGFNISVASEIMAVLCLSNNLSDFKNRVAKIVVAYTFDDKPVTIADLQIVGAVAMIMKDALNPNIVQTLEGNLTVMHGGPFANIAHGCNSVLATKLAQKLGDYVVTEAGFGVDLGSEKFVDIKCRQSGIRPSAVVIVATVRALKMHGGQPLDELKQENVDALLQGVSNLQKHIETVKAYGLPYVVAINKFLHDTSNEVDALFKWCQENGHTVVESDVWAKGGNGGIELAQAVVDACQQDSELNFIYSEDDSLQVKVDKIVKVAYGGNGAVWTDHALSQLETYKKHGWDKLPVCMAKTQNSLSDDPKKIGRPVDFEITIRELSVSAGAGFVVVLTGAMMTMPGLPKRPAALDMDIDENGKMEGLF